MTQTVTKEQIINDRAYEIWQAEGCPHGRALEHWLAAEREIKSTDSALLKGPSRSALAAENISALSGGIRKSAPANPGKRGFSINRGKKSLTQA